MCKVFDELREETALYKTREIAMELIELGEDSYEKIARVTKLSLAEVKELAEGMPA